MNHKWLIATLCLTFSASCAMSQTIWYVDGSLTNGLNDGTSWTNAFRTIQPALSNTGMGDPSEPPYAEIWVAKGVYKPGNTRTNSFEMKISATPLYGGFTNGMAARAERDWQTYPTILSGDLLGNDSTNFQSRADNAYHIITATYISDTRWDGFIIHGGCATNPLSVRNNGTADIYDDRGGAVFIEGGRGIRFYNCVFTDNQAENGGVFYASDSGPIRLYDSIIAGNWATTSSNDWGGGVMTGKRVGGIYPTMLTASRTIFAGNRAPLSYGGVLYTPTLSGSRFGANFTNCLFAGNLSNTNTPSGGAIFYRATTQTGSVPSTVFNCTFAGNLPDAIFTRSTTCTVVNTIIWGNGVELDGYTDDDRPFNISYTDLNLADYDGFNGNIQSDPVWYTEAGTWTGSPVFNRTNATTRLTNSAANWPTDGLIGQCVNVDTNSNIQFYISANTKNTLTVWGDASAGFSGKPYIIYDYRLGAGSPCISGGTESNAPPLDLINTIRPQARIFDMGTYEYTGTEVAPQITYVNTNATAGSNTGTNWANAYLSLTNALAKARVGSEVWVAAGTYRPSSGTNRSATFNVVAGVELYGGFAGTETTRDERIVRTHPTYLSGDLNQNDQNDALDSADLHINRIDNTYHILTIRGSGTVVDGFVFAGGYARVTNSVDMADNRTYAGAIYVLSGVCRINNCLFTDNFADQGGAITSGANGTPTITQCTFSGNWAGAGGAGFHNGMVTYDRCVFAGQKVSGEGSGASLWFQNEQSSGRVFSPLVQNCLFAGNYGGFDGAIRVEGQYGLNNPVVMNCTIAKNQGVWNSAIFLKRQTKLDLINSIVYGNISENTGPQIGLSSDNLRSNATVNVSYDNIENGAAGIGGTIYDKINIIPADKLIMGDPLFAGGPVATITAVSYHSSKKQTLLTVSTSGFDPGTLAGTLLNPNSLQMRQYVIADNTANTLTVWGDASQVTSTGKTLFIEDYSINNFSPCIDFGTITNAPAEDLRGTLRPQKAGIDLGAFEYLQPPGSKTGLMLVVQ